MKANTILVNWLEKLPPLGDDRSKEVYGQNLRLAHDQGYNAVILHCREDAMSRIEDVPDAERRIDIWWAGGAVSAFSLILAYLTRRTPDWSQATWIRIGWA